MEAPDDRPRATVLVVEDEPDLLEMYGEWLEHAYDIERAATGGEALELADESTDLVLLDRQLPDVSGSEVLGSLRAAGYDCAVAMVTAVEPDVDIAEMGFDDYVEKPVFDEELNDVVERVLRRRSYDRRVQEYFAVVSKLGALPDVGNRVVETEEYRRLVERKADLRASIEESTDARDELQYEASMAGFASVDVSG